MESEQAILHGLNKGCGSKFCVGSRVRQTPEDWRTYWPKRCEYNNKDEDTSPKTLNDKNQASSQKFRHLIFSSNTNNFQTSIWPINETLTGTFTLSQSESGSNIKERGAPYSLELQDWSITIRCSLPKTP